MSATPVPAHAAGWSVLRRSSPARLAALLARPVASALERGRGAAPSTPGLRGWASTFRVTLRENILPFWLQHGVDREHGGMFGWLDRAGRPSPPGIKSIVPHMRLVWLFSAAHAASSVPEPAYRDGAEHALAFVRLRLQDRRCGGYCWWVDREGRMVDNRKYLYGQSFALLGLAEYARAFDDAQARQEALDLFDLLDRCARDHAHGGYVQVLSGDWQDVLEGDRFFGIAGGRHQNHQIALLQGFSSLYAATGEARVGHRLGEVIDVLSQRFVDPETGSARIRLSQDWSPLGPEISSYGHDIELSWLLSAAAALDRADDPVIRRAALGLAGHTLEHGFDHRRGGVYWEGVPGGAATKRRKVWWPQAEALVGLLNAFELTGAARFRAAFERQAQYVWRHCIDHRYGEWFEWAGPVGQVFGAKASIWKDAFHQGRACLEVARRLDALAKPGRPARSRENA